MAKKFKKGTFYRRVDPLLHQVIRLRDDHKCQRCHKRGGRMEASHIFPKGKNPGMRYLIQNVKLLCHPCHRWWHEHPLESGMWIREYLGKKKYEALLQASQKIELVNEVFLRDQEENLKELKAYYEKRYE